MYALITDNWVLYYLGYGAFALMGLLKDGGYIFYSFLLIDIMTLYPQLKIVGSALFSPMKQFAVLFAIFMFCNYLTMIIAYSYSPLYKVYDGYCSSTLACLLTICDVAFKSDGALGGWLGGNTPISNDLSQSVMIFRFTYDNIYNFFVAIIMVSIVSGIIIDQFGEDREELDALETDKNTMCFICNKELEILDKAMGTKNVKCHVKVQPFSTTHFLV